MKNCLKPRIVQRIVLTISKLIVFSLYKSRPFFKICFLNLPHWRQSRNESLEFCNRNSFNTHYELLFYDPSHARF